MLALLRSRDRRPQQHQDCVGLRAGIASLDHQRFARSDALESHQFRIEIDVEQAARQVLELCKTALPRLPSFEIGEARHDAAAAAVEHGIEDLSFRAVAAIDRILAGTALRNDTLHRRRGVAVPREQLRRDGEDALLDRLRLSPGRSSAAPGACTPLCAWLCRDCRLHAFNLVRRPGIIR